MCGCVCVCKMCMCVCGMGWGCVLEGFSVLNKQSMKAFQYEGCASEEAQNDHCRQAG